MSEREGDIRRDRLRRKLLALVECIMEHADTSAGFAAKLDQALFNDSSIDAPTVKSASLPTKQAFNPVLFLKHHGVDALQRELETLTDDDLRAVLRFQGLRKGKELKKLDREGMLREIQVGAQAKLQQGMVVARVGASEGADASPPADPPGTASDSQPSNNS
jgi:hypothetical protein